MKERSVEELKLLYAGWGNRPPTYNPHIALLYELLERASEDGVFALTESIADFCIARGWISEGGVEKLICLGRELDVAKREQELLQRLRAVAGELATENYWQTWEETRPGGGPVVYGRYRPITLEEREQHRNELQTSLLDCKAELKKIRESKTDAETEPEEVRTADEA
jgi:hypothetical protein